MVPCKVPRGPAGVIYHVTSPCLNAVKMGFWRSDLQSLRRRYATVYGPDLRLETKHVGDCRAIESRFNEHRLGGELFDKSRLEEYSACIKTAGELLPVLVRRSRKPRYTLYVNNMFYSCPKAEQKLFRWKLVIEWYHCS